ncbi:MAG: thioredoxin family protein [Kiritimatiellaeota bacterium]|nr:thioredoxin family protein [Kiritimatiellota bacterium]
MIRFRLHAALLCAVLSALPAFCAPRTPRVPEIKIAQEGSKPGEWTLDFEAAKKAAAETGHPILLLFIIEGNKPGDTFKRQILDQPEWKKFAAENLHLVWVDVPNSAGKSGVPEPFAGMHKTLQKLRPGGASPNINVLDSDGKTSLGGWSGIPEHHTPAYFCDLVKSYMVMREPKTETPDGKPAAKPAPKSAPPQPALIKPAREGAKPGEWTLDFDAAQKLAEKNKTPMVVFVTGSDWNRQSQATVKNIFSRPGWDSYAKEKKLALVWADFPEDKSKVPEHFTAKIKDLRKGYTPNDAFPACFVLDSDGIMKLAAFDKDLPGMTLRGLQEAVRPHLPKK